MQREEVAATGHLHISLRLYTCVSDLINYDCMSQRYGIQGQLLLRTRGRRRVVRIFAASQGRLSCMDNKLESGHDSRRLA
jgi:hypothetical protein